MVKYARLLGKTASYKVHTLIVIWTNSYIQICLFQEFHTPTNALLFVYSKILV